MAAGKQITHSQPEEVVMKNNSTWLFWGPVVGISSTIKLNYSGSHIIKNWPQNKVPDMETKDADHKTWVCCLQHTKDKFDGGSMIWRF